MKHLFRTLLCFLLVNYSFSQQTTAPTITSTVHTFKSTVLGTDRIIDIYIPPAYKTDANRHFPVLYVLDGQEYFLPGIAYQDMLRFRDKSPDFIIVGIRTNRRTRRRLFYQDSNAFASFLNAELVPFIDNTYRTFKAKERILFGWEMAAGLGFELLHKHPQLFSAYILASPSHLRRRMQALTAEKLSGNSPFLLVSTGPEEHWIRTDSLLQASIKKRANWRMALYPREDHYTTPMKTMHEGLSDYFGDYKPVRKQTLEAYDAYGGVPALRKYYAHRGKRYGLATSIHRETQHFLIFNAMAENRIDRFEHYVKEFGTYIPSISRAFWFKRYANFYAKHAKNKKAKELLEFGLSKHANSTLLLEALGDYYISVKKNRKAKHFYKKALAIDKTLSSVLEKLKE